MYDQVLGSRFAIPMLKHATCPTLSPCLVRESERENETEWRESRRRLGELMPRQRADVSEMHPDRQTTQTRQPKQTLQCPDRLLSAPLQIPPLASPFDSREIVKHFFFRLIRLCCDMEAISAEQKQASKHALSAALGLHAITALESTTICKLQVTTLLPEHARDPLHRIRHIPCFLDHYSSDLTLQHASFLVNRRSSTKFIKTSSLPRPAIQSVSRWRDAFVPLFDA